MAAMSTLGQSFLGTQGETDRGGSEDLSLTLTEPSLGLLEFMHSRSHKNRDICLQL